MLALSLTYYPVTYPDMAGRPYRTGRSIATPGVEATSDGLVGVGVGTGQQWLDFCVIVDHPEWREDRKLLADPRAPRPDIPAWMAAHSIEEVMRQRPHLAYPPCPPRQRRHDSVDRPLRGASIHRLEPE